jgi:hypothetical protein
MNENFYLTIPSNTRTAGAKNTASHFRATLPRRIELKGDWECALVEAHYTYSYFNVRHETKDGKNYENNFVVKKQFDTSIPEDKEEKERTGTSGVTKVLAISDGNYNNVTELCDAINMSAQKEMNLPIMFTTNHVMNGRVYFQKPANVVAVTLSDTMAYMLGFANAKLSKSQRANGMGDLRNGIDQLYIYCSIIEEQFVGDSMEQLLRTIAVSGKFGDVVAVNYPIPHYVRVLCKEFSTIEFYIFDDSSRFIDFQYGKTVLKLHFRHAPNRFLSSFG